MTKLRFEAMQNRIPLIMKIMAKSLLLVFAISLTLGAGLLIEAPKIKAPQRVPFYYTQSTWADSLLNAMTVDEKIGQLFMVAAYSNRDKAHQDYLSKLIREHSIGGLIFFQGGPHRQAKMTNALQAQSRIPLMIGMDAEWGLGMRLDSTINYPRQLLIGATMDDSAVYRFGSEMARQLARLGVHVSFSPVIDVNNNPNNPVINDRSFGEDKINVALKGLNYMDGLQDNGVLACGKHFPGHGDTDVDSHKGLPVIEHDYERLESLELYPFRVLISQGLGSIMLAHLYIPALDNTPKQASSISPKVGRALLRDSLGFKGLVFSDALNMKGVSAYFKPGELEVKAFLAGNDILLFSEDVPKAASAIKAALADGTITMTQLDESVHKILLAKAWQGLEKYKPIELNGLTASLNNTKAQMPMAELAEQSLTLVNNANDLLPLRRPDTVDMACLMIGTKTLQPFQETLTKYKTIPTYQLDKNASPEKFGSMLEKLSDKELVIVGLKDMSRYASKGYGISAWTKIFLDSLKRNTNVALVVFGSPYSLEKLPEVPITVVAYEDKPVIQQNAAQAIFGGKPFIGFLPVSAGSYSFAEGIPIYETSRLAFTEPGLLGINADHLDKIDSIAQDAIRIGATPGCRIMAAREGEIFFDRAYGHHTYSRKRKVKDEDIYDLASITKVAATTLCLMKMYEEDLIQLDQKLGTYLPFLKGSEVGDMKIRNVMTHQAGLRAWIPFYRITQDDEKGKALLPGVYSKSEKDGYSFQVADNMYMRNDYIDSVWRRIKESDVGRTGKYKYSDVGFYLFKRLIEDRTGMPIQDYLDVHFYSPLALNTMGYLPLNRFSRNQIVPTEFDQYWRNQLLQGHVHDMGAAMFGGVQGHAGLFSDARDLVVLMQMLLNEGSYGGIQYLTPETVKIFTAQQNENCRRGLCFDKPEFENPSLGPTSEKASPLTYGHSGFTGTCVWVDPQYNLIYVFLSNRIHPDMENKKLIKENVRTKIQDVIYESLPEWQSRQP